MDANAELEVSLSFEMEKSSELRNNIFSEFESIKQLLDKHDEYTESSQYNKNSTFKEFSRKDSVSEVPFALPSEKDRAIHHLYNCGEKSNATTAATTPPVSVRVSSLLAKLREIQEKENSKVERTKN